MVAILPKGPAFNYTRGNCQASDRLTTDRWDGLKSMDGYLFAKNRPFGRINLLKQKEITAMGLALLVLGINR